MSSENDKLKRSKRLHADAAKAKRQASIAKAYGIEVNTAHKYEKTHALTCGNSDCVMCGNPRKFTGERTIQERRLMQMPNEELLVETI